MNNLFDDTRVDPNQGDLTPNPDQGDGNVYEQIVGDGKKFRDNEALARGKLESDRYIKELEGRLDELNADLRERLTLEKVMEQLKPPVSNVQPQVGHEEGNDNRGVSLDDVSKLVQETLQKDKTENTQKQNLLYVKDKLVEKFGEGYAPRVKAKIKELGMEENFANGLAATQPKAFLALIANVAQDVTPDNSPPRSSVNTNSSARFGVKKWSDFQKVRREDPALYHSPKFQMEMHKAALDQGPDFYKP